MAGRTVEIARAAWGATLLLRPTAVLRTVERPTSDSRGTAVTRILGARQLTQGLLSGLSPSPEVLAMGVWVDATHAVTALALATSDRSRSRAGLVDAAVAAVWAGLGYRDLARASATPAGHERVRDALARRVLAVVPAGRHLLLFADRTRDQDVPAAAVAPPEPQPAQASTRFVVIRPEGDIDDSDLASIYEGEWRERADLDDPAGIELDGPHGVVRAVPTDRVEQSPDGHLGQVYEVPETPDSGTA